MTVNPEDNQGDDVAGDRDAIGQDAPDPPPAAVHPPQPPADGGADVPGGDDDTDNTDEDMEDNDSDESSSDSPEEGYPEDPKQAGMGNYNAQTPNGKMMVKMLKRFCDRTDHDANAIIMYFCNYSVI